MATGTPRTRLELPGRTGRRVGFARAMRPMNRRSSRQFCVILGTARGERVMRPEFGSRLRELVFASAHQLHQEPRRQRDHRCAGEMGAAHRRAQRDVPRSNVTDAGTLVVNIEYRVRATNSVFNLVYPFYLREGSNAPPKLLRSRVARPGARSRQALARALLRREADQGGAGRLSARDDPGRQLIELAARLIELLAERVNRVPEKNLLAFLDLSGVERAPGVPAEAPVTFPLSPRSEEGHWFRPGRRWRRPSRQRTPPRCSKRAIRFSQRRRGLCMSSVWHLAPTGLEFCCRLDSATQARRAADASGPCRS